MSLILPFNLNFDLYRGFNAASPYPGVGVLPDVPNKLGALVQHMKCGRFGYQTLDLYWTYQLLTTVDLDIRSAYNSQLGAYDSTKADTLIANDFPLTAWQTAFYVVATIRDRDQNFKRCYLDRLQP